MYKEKIKIIKDNIPFSEVPKKFQDNMIYDLAKSMVHRRTKRTQGKLIKGFTIKRKRRERIHWGIKAGHGEQSKDSGNYCWRHRWTEVQVK